MNKKQLHWRNRIIVAILLFAIAEALELTGVLHNAFGNPGEIYAEFVLFFIPFIVAGYDVIWKAIRNIGHGQIFDENFLMSIATIGAFALVLFPDTEPHMAEGAAVMIFYQVGELFQSYAVAKSRKSISDMMDIAPEYANIMVDGALVKVDPYEIAVGDEIVVKPGERIPLDGIVVNGESQIDTSALTGEPVPRSARAGEEVISGCMNLTSILTVKVTKPFEDSTVSRILELVENAADKKAKTENFITRFARYYTPIVVFAALALSIIPPLVFGDPWADWIQRGLVFLVVSCPCALVISVPLSFFGGIGGASRVGVLIKGSNYLETLSHTDTVVFDKTGTLTNGTFSVSAVHAEGDMSEDELLEIAAHAEAYSNHPIAESVRRAYGKPLSNERISEVEEISGQGIRTVIDKKLVLVGNDKLMGAHDSSWKDCELVGTILHINMDGQYMGHIVIADIIKDDAAEAIAALKAAGVSKTVMLTGDRTDVARSVAKTLGIDEVHSELLPQDKVAIVEELLSQESGKSKLAFVGDGINDAPVLTRSDIGIAMGAMGSDVAIEAADVVLMDDEPSKIALAIRIARKTMGIVWENIVFALAIKFAVLILAAFGLANMWMAVFADVGVSVIAILNAMRAMRVQFRPPTGGRN